MIETMLAVLAGARGVLAGARPAAKRAPFRAANGLDPLWHGKKNARPRCTKCLCAIACAYRPEYHGTLPDNAVCLDCLAELRRTVLPRERGYVELFLGVKVWDDPFSATSKEGLEPPRAPTWRTRRAHLRRIK